MTDIHVREPWWVTHGGIRRRCPTCDSSFPIEAEDGFFATDKKGRRVSKSKAVVVVCPVCGEWIDMTAPKEERGGDVETVIISFLAAALTFLTIFLIFA